MPEPTDTERAMRIADDNELKFLVDRFAERVFSTRQFLVRDDFQPGMPTRDYLLELLTELRGSRARSSGEAARRTAELHVIGAADELATKWLHLETRYNERVPADQRYLVDKVLVLRALARAPSPPATSGGENG